MTNCGWVNLADMTAAVFPGQGSQEPGMGRDLYESFEESRSVFEQVSRATGIDVGRLCFESDESVLRETQNAQIALFTCAVAAWSALEAACPVSECHAVAGHSVGEYAALVAAEVVSIEDGARLVQARGRIMGRCGKETPGTMAAVLGMERAQLEAICAQTDGVVVIANDNCPGQLVISGEVKAVEAAGIAATGAGAKRVLPLNVSGAFHSPLMDDAASEMGRELAAVVFKQGSRSVYANVTAEKVTDSTDWPHLMERQLCSPVRWTETIENMKTDGVTTFVECGGGAVLSGLIRRIDKNALTARIADRDSLAKTLETLMAA